VKYDTPRQQEKHPMSDIATAEEREAHFAEEALNYIAEAEGEKGKLKKHLLVLAYGAAIASGVAHFQASVARGSCPRALPYDCSISVQVALEKAGFKITKAPARR
tara:strand:+ start:1008 stop:1322 length:315 start_codon:yes stop_codon:yes gene_type:complete